MHTRGTFDLVAGFVYAQTLYALVQLDAFSHLAGGPRSTHDLAIDLDMPEPSVEILMNSAHAIGLVDRRAKGWGLALKGAAMLGQRGIAEMVAHHETFYADLADPVKLLREGQDTALSRFWTYTANDRECRGDPAHYTALMAASQAFVADAVLHQPVFANTAHLVDLGGGSGAFGIAALRCHPNLTVTVADRPKVVPFASKALEDAGFAGRSGVKPLDFFTDSLAFDADTISLVRILHDHDDGPVGTLLSRIAQHAPRAKLVIIEPMADPHHPTGVDAYFPWYFKAMGQGRLRSRTELTALLKGAGYSAVKAIRSRNPVLVKGLVATV